MTTREIDITSDKMPELLQAKLEKLSPFTKRYAEFRAKGLKQSDASKKAGSNASTRKSLGRVGYNTEQQDGVKEYIAWLDYRRAKASVIDDLEIIDKLREVYDNALADGKYSDANKAVEHLANMSGLFEKNKADAKKSSKDNSSFSNSENGTENNSSLKNDTSSFTDELEGLETEDRLKRLRVLSSVANKTKVKSDKE